LKTKIQSLVVIFSLPQRKKTKRKVDLVSSHSDNERENGPLAAYSTEGSAVSELYNNDRIPSFMRYVPKEGEQVVYEEIFIPDPDVD
jgi:hypothetical protein